jgi:hypothetical protein
MGIESENISENIVAVGLTLDGTSLNTTDWDSSDTTNLVHILKWETKWLVNRTAWLVDSINSLEKSLSSGLGLGFLLPTLVPWGVGGWLNHVVTIETRYWDEWDMLGVVSDLLDEVGGFFDNFVETILGPLGGIHLVDGNNKLLDTKSVGEQSVLTSLTILGDTSLEFTSTSSNDENSAISLGCTSDHVLDKVTMSRGIWRMLTLIVCGAHDL